MNITSARLIYFSPTGTTKKVLEATAQGIHVPSIEHTDLTRMDAGKSIDATKNALTIIGSPVYSGRLPALAVNRLGQIRGNNAPAIVIVVYGNRAYEDALLELRDLAGKAGFRPVAAAAFIGEHSYSTTAFPIATGRPDQKDLSLASTFGRKITEKMRTGGLSEELPLIHVPGNFPYKERAGLQNVSPVTDEAICTLCRQCLSVCPSAAIALDDRIVTDPSLCIRCCACIKSCSPGARAMHDPRIRQVVEQLSIKCRDRKEPELYL